MGIAWWASSFRYDGAFVHIFSFGIAFACGRSHHNRRLQQLNAWQQHDKRQLPVTRKIETARKK